MWQRCHIDIYEIVPEELSRLVNSSCTHDGVMRTPTTGSHEPHHSAATAVSRCLRQSPLRMRAGIWSGAPAQSPLSFQVASIQAAMASATAFSVFFSAFASVFTSASLGTRAVKVRLGSVLGRAAVGHIHQFPHGLAPRTSNFDDHHDPINDRVNHVLPTARQAPHPLRSSGRR